MESAPTPRRLLRCLVSFSRSRRESSGKILGPDVLWMKKTKFTEEQMPFALRSIVAQ